MITETTPMRTRGFSANFGCIFVNVKLPRCIHLVFIAAEENVSYSERRLYCCAIGICIVEDNQFFLFWLSSHTLSLALM